MTLIEVLTQYLRESGELMRSLSLRSGLGEKAVADILRIPGLKPRGTTLAALSQSTGLDLSVCLDRPAVYYSDLINGFDAVGEKRRAARLRWLTRVAGWVPETTPVCRREVIEFLRGRRGIEFRLTDGSFATYSSEVIAIVTGAEPRRRKRGSHDLTGTYAAILAKMNSDECGLPEWQVGVARPFLVFLHAHQIQISEITTETLAIYFAERMTASSKPELKCRQHVIEVANFLRKASKLPTLEVFGFNAVPHPFGKYSGKYGVDDELVASLMREFDIHVAPWALGKISRTGQPLAAFIAELDKQEAPISDRKALLLQRRAKKAARPGQNPAKNTHSNGDELAAAGFLTEKQTWSPGTLKTRRGYIVALAKATIATVDIVPQSMEELLDPDFLETALDGIKSANSGGFSSGYLGSILKCARKIARDFQCRPANDLARISDLIEIHDVKRKGIAPRNRAKLLAFDEARIQRTIDLGDMIISDVNVEIEQRRIAHRKKHGVMPARADVIDPELGRDIMTAIAHEILLRNAPRSDNLIRAKLSWIGWQGDLARITVPAVQVKMRGPDDEPLTLYLDGRQSKLLRSYLDTVRAKCLVSGDERNPYLFPGQVRKDKAGQPYKTLLKRVTRVLNRKVGSKIYPHLYRHLVGWIWLKESVDNLPKVQRLLGHKRLQTTLDYYAELDPGLVFDEWNKHLNEKSAAGRSKAS